VFLEHPVLKFSLPWWFQSPVWGAWMNFLLVLFAYPIFADILEQMFGSNSLLSSPYWFVAEGALIGLLIGYAATRIAGEGPETAGR